MTSPTDNDSRPVLLIVEMALTVYGGIERVMLSVLPLINRRWRVVYCDLWGNSEYAALMRERGVEVLHLLPESRRKFIGGKGSLLRPLLVLAKLPWLVRSQLKLWKWIRRSRPDVIFFNRWEIVRAFLRVVPAGIPCVFQSHGHASSADIPRGLVRALNRRFARVIAVSQKTLEMLADAGVNRGKLIRIYNAVDPVAIRTAAASGGPDIPPRIAGDVIFVHPAVIAPHKGQIVSIEALSRIPDESAKLWICGDTQTDAGRPYKQLLERRVAELSLTHRVTFLGWRSDVPRIMAASDVVVLPSESHSESFGLVLAEGMVLGKACVGTNRGGVPEVIADGVTGLVREPTGEAFAEAMEQLAGDPDLRHRMGTASSQRVEGLFTLDRQCDAFLEGLAEARGTNLKA